MKYCPKCGSELLDDAVVCTSCGCSVKEPKKEGAGLAICALIFGFLGGLLGLILGIIGTIKYKTKSYKIMSIIGMVVAAIWIIYGIININSLLGGAMALALL